MVKCDVCGKTLEPKDALVCSECNLVVCFDCSTELGWFEDMESRDVCAMCWNKPDSAGEHECEGDDIPYLGENYLEFLIENHILSATPLDPKDIVWN